jgi:23S rRNA (pseudouridine1915-N3)-methyltransferase
VSATGVRSREGERLLERVPSTARLVACDERGDRLTSAQFATLVGEARDRAQDLAFMIGGAYGLSDAVRARADRALQLAPWTLPHELARLVLAEQIYRAGTLVRGEPYHK